MNVNSEEFVEVINRLYDKFSLFAGSTVAQADEESKLEAEYKVNETCNIFGSRYEMYSEHALPKIVCLCGSTRFVDEYRCCNHQETLKGNIVLTVGCFNQYDITPPQKEALDELHKRKIDLCDEVLVIDVDGYIGTSTQSEIAYALEKGKVVRYVSQSD